MASPVVVGGNVSMVMGEGAMKEAADQRRPGFDSEDGLGTCPWFARTTIS
ncbi:MAG: hypothetical protein QM722_03015 [Piscinibacter sp.]